MLDRGFGKCNAFSISLRGPTVEIQHDGYSHMRNLFQNTLNPKDQKVLHLPKPR